MSAQTFAAHARHAPNPCQTIHTDNNPTPYTCHMAVMHWSFRELGDNQATANARVQAITQSKCLGCAAGHALHSSIPSQ
jgi:hypothetical protein